MNSKRFCKTEARVRRPAIRAFLGSLLLCLLGSSFASAATPDWLRNLAKAPQKKYADDVNAVVLLDEGETTVRDNGEIVTHGRTAYRILRPEGRDYARFELPFDSETKITYLHGWSITAKGLEYEAKEKDAFERNISTFEVFSDEKEKALLLPGGEVGTVVGFEFEQKRRPFLFDDVWFVQGLLPVERSRYVLRVPAGWEYRADWINHPKQDPVEENGAYIWELSDVPRIEKEYNEPPYRAMAGAILIRFYSEKVKGQTFRSWNDLGLWESQLTLGTRTASPALQQKVQELAPASLPMFERIKALATFAQRDVRYAAIEVGIGGFKPHPASEIFAHRYGDCKDKATVLSSMLAEIGVKSFYMPIHADRGIVTDKTPPSQTFNHVILAIQLPNAANVKPLPALYEHPKLGHLLLFDPTNDLVPLGQLPHYEQDSYALLVTDDGGELIHLPVSAPETNRLSRTAKVKLLPDGTLQGEVEEVTTGYRAALKRGLLKDKTEKDRRKILELILGSTLGNLQVDDFTVTNADDLDKDFILRYKFTASHYAKNAGPLLLVRPHVVGEFAGYLDAGKPRHYPYEISAPFCSNESVEITLPDGYKVDELPEPAKTTVPFAEYSSKTENSGSVLKYTREYKMRTTLVPVEKIDLLKTLFGAINLDEKNMAVLKKAN
jgi:hypothetical protein